MNSGFSIWSLQPLVFSLPTYLPSHVVGGGARSGFESTFFQVVEGSSGSGSHDQCSVPIRSELGGRALHGCLDLDPSLFDKLRIEVFRQFSEWRMFFTPSAIVKVQYRIFYFPLRRRWFRLLQSQIEISLQLFPLRMEEDSVGCL